MRASKNYVIAGALAAGVWGALPSAWAESQVGDPGAFGITVDQNASGTKVSGPVTLSYDYELGTDRANGCVSQRWILNIYAVATFTKGNLTQAFNSNYDSAGLSRLQDCFDNQDNQVAFLKNFLEQIIIPKFFACTPGACPGYAVKTIKNFLTTGTGAGYLEVELAVKQ
jgi:hypothetical protein